MLSLTREYALAELAAYPDFEKEARRRWVKWYLDFAYSYAGEDWEKWIHYNSAQNWLADLAIEQGDRDEAQKLLIQGLTVAESSNNKRRLARYQRSLACWEKKWGSVEKAYQLSTKALNGFKHLGMTRDVEEMQNLLD
ncbi:hypothetical protein [aff. Roholtiella sp. LEGE 12411]|uniref:hypothetical protein n=1 Tax=aff. Roholtiella sp. LEGE 12411 TaxID=1828822 RepID=UPI001FC7FB49|nr:hypothetical protein [aff. Roholtiella sp. LEGE 12411]